MALLATLIATIIISLGGLLGVLTFWVREKTLENSLRGLVAVSAGVMMGVTFFDLLPEAAEMIEPDILFPLLLTCFVGFFFVEKILHWRHCHKETCEVHSFGYMNLLGDGIHNFIDGMLIAAAFGVDLKLGIGTTLAVALHEIPQEISDFGVLLYAGFSRNKALIANFGVASLAVIGGIFGSLMSASFNGFEPYMLVLAAGSFLYIAASDLIPELRKVQKGSSVYSGMVLFLIGVFLIAGLQQFMGHSHVDAEHESEADHLLEIQGDSDL